MTKIYNTLVDFLSNTLSEGFPDPPIKTHTTNTFIRLSLSYSHFTNRYIKKVSSPFFVNI